MKLPRLLRHRRRIRYYYDERPQQKGKARTIALVVIVLLIIVAVIAGLIIMWDSRRQAKRDSSTDATKPITQSYKPDTKTFTTPYFQMETTNSWEFIEKSSTPNKFIYHNIRNKLVRGTLTVYVNAPPSSDQQEATRLLPVRLGEDGFLKSDPTVSDHCNKVAPGKDKVGSEQIKFKNIVFPCDNDATWYSALAGLDGGSTDMKLKRPDGSTAQYIIYYTNPSAELTGGDFVEVLHKFQIK